jgi:hypothetical protein
VKGVYVSRVFEIQVGWERGDGDTDTDTGLAGWRLTVDQTMWRDPEEKKKDQKKNRSDAGAMGLSVGFPLSPPRKVANRFS